MIITHNMMAENILNQYKSNQLDSAVTAGKLASGYQIRVAADNAAGLQVSEGMRAQVRGLMQAARNSEEGADFVQTGDGAMNEMASILQRMRELGIQSSNDTYTDEDRAMMQLEFDQLQSEIDRINDQTEYNTLPVFEHYTDTFYTFEGNKYWCQDQIHKIQVPDNSLKIKYQISETEPEKEMTLEIPSGNYTTQELMDAMDDVVHDKNGADGLYLEYNKNGMCNMVLQNGEKINDVSGGLSYLFFDSYGGSDAGMLIGTTEFYPGSPLWVNGQNNRLAFKIEYYTGNDRDVDITVPAGYYSRQQMIDYLNTQLTGTGMKAMEHGDYCIKIGGEDGIITGLRGNMFKIDDPRYEQAMSSVFYDNTKYGGVSKTPSTFQGGNVLHSSDSNSVFSKFHITDANNKLSVKLDAGSSLYKTVTLEKGDYTISQMTQLLQQKLDALGLKIDVAQTSSTEKTANGNWITFYGLSLTSREKGKGYHIEFDRSASTAYDTLFVDRAYTDDGDDVSASSGVFSSRSASLTGGRTFEAKDFPLTINGDNNTFRLRITEKDPSTGNSSSADYNITLTQKTYSDLSELIREIDRCLNGTGAASAVKGKLSVRNNGQKIQFTNSDTNKSVTEILFAESSSKGYQALFVGSKITTSDKQVSSGSSRTPEVTLDKVKEPINYDKDKTLTVNVGGGNKTVRVPAGTYTRDTLAETISNQLKGGTVTSPKGYSASGKGSTTDRRGESYTGTGSSSTAPIYCNVKGAGTPVQGTTREEDTSPASYTTTTPLPDSFEVKKGAAELNITINGNPYTIGVPAGTYTPATLAMALQTSLDQAVTARGNEIDKLKITVGSNKLTFTTVYEGSARTIQFNAVDSPLFNDLYTTKTPASQTIDIPLQSGIVIKAGADSFTCSVDGTAYTVNLPEGIYSQTSFGKALNQAFQDQGVKAQASVSGGRLTLSTTEANGAASRIGYSTDNGGSACEAVFGKMVQTTPASATISQPLQSHMVIKTGENKYSVKVTDENGVPSDVTVTIPEGNYTPESLAAMLNILFQAKGIKVSQSAGLLNFTTVAEGQNVSLMVNSTINGAGSAGKAMFGENTVTTPDVKASVTADGKLKLTGSDTGSSYAISVSSKTSPDFLEPDKTTTKVSPTSTRGSLTATHYTLRSSNDLGTGIDLKDYESDFSFSYNENGISMAVSMTLPSGKYTADQLRQRLQNEIDSKLGNNKLKVSINSDDGISITAADYGSQYSMSNMSGGFYKYVLQGTAERAETQMTSSAEGKQLPSETYIIGRKEIRGNDVTITDHLTDEFGMDLTMGGTTYTMKMKLPAGTYSNDALLGMLQTELNKQLVGKGLPENSVLAGIGKYDSGVTGASDADALQFYMNDQLNLPEGDCRIDNLTGNALYEFFYKTEGDLLPAFLTGTKDVTKGVEIDPKRTGFEFCIDDVKYSYDLPAGQYTSEELVHMLNQVLDQPDQGGKTAPIHVTRSGNSVKFAFEKLGKHKIHNVSGPAAPAIFTESDGRKDHNSDLNIQVGANAGQMVALKRYSMSTLSMGINSLTIGKWKNAQKAIGRLDEAITYLSTRRSNYGAQQNRLEQVVRADENTAENLQASESKLRDADMAKETVANARQNILRQAQMSMLAQANETGRRVVDLLSGFSRA